MPALPPYTIEPIWQQLSALLPERQTNHPLGCHRPRVPDRVVFEKLVQILVFGCAYEKIAEEGCSATTLRRRRDEWIGLGLVETLRRTALEAYDRLVGLELLEVAVDCCTTKAPCGGESRRGSLRKVRIRGFASLYTFLLQYRLVCALLRYSSSSAATSSRQKSGMPQTEPGMAQRRATAEPGRNVEVLSRARTRQKYPPVGDRRWRSLALRLVFVHKRNTIRSDRVKKGSPWPS